VRPASTADLDAMVEVANAYDVADLGRPDTAVEHLADGFHARGFDAGRDTRLVLAPDGSVAAFGIVGLEPGAVVEAFGRVRPEHAGRGVGSFLVAEAETRAAELARGRAGGVVLHNAATSTDGASRRLLEGRGYRVVRYFWHMERDLDDAVAVPGGSAWTVRPVADLQEQRAARAALDEAFRSHWMFEALPFEGWREHLEAMGGSVLVATDRGEVMGAVTSMPTSASGWIEELGVREPWRGRGLGAALLRGAFARLGELGMREVRLNVDADNETGATRLYERVGMRVRREWLVYEKPLRAG
jgi:ribosomal protein S18 acetylase RimI-like enzyme